MKYIFTVLFSFLSCFLFAGIYSIDKTAEAKKWLKDQPLSFIENKGQFTESENKPTKVQLLLTRIKLNTCEKLKKTIHN